MFLELTFCHGKNWVGSFKSPRRQIVKFPKWQIQPPKHKTHLKLNLNTDLWFLKYMREESKRYYNCSHLNRWVIPSSDSDRQHLTWKQRYGIRVLCRFSVTVMVVKMNISHLEVYNILSCDISIQRFHQIEWTLKDHTQKATGLEVRKVHFQLSFQCLTRCIYQHSRLWKFRQINSCPAE